jgi:Family of unknown function (DUF6117)
MALRKSDKKNFATLSRAFGQGQVALVDVLRLKDRKKVAAVCAMQSNGDGTVTMIPFATLVEGNPFEEFAPPSVDGGYEEPHDENVEG